MSSNDCLVEGEENLTSESQTRRMGVIGSHSYSQAGSLYKVRRIINRVKNVSFLIIQPSLLHLQPRKLAGIENHRGGKQSSPKPKETPFPVLFRQ